MKVKHIVFTIVVVLASIGYVNAENPTTVNPQPVLPKPTVEVDDQSSILTSITDDPESINLDMYLNSSSLNDLEYFNLTFGVKNSSDSLNTGLVRSYIKRMLPHYRNLDSQNNEMIEIL
jgi:hypothetical protein